MEDQLLEELIALFLQINPEPSDTQVHALAESLGIDKEVLEAKMFSMLSDDEDLLDDAEVDAAFEVGADSQDILEDPHANPDEMSTTDVALNDGDPTNDDLGMQEETDDDGFDATDTGVGMTPAEDEDALNDDGVPDISLNK